MSADRHLRHPIASARRTLPYMLEMAADRYGDKVLFRCGADTWRYDETPIIAAAMAGRLTGAGIARGDRVAILSSNRPDVMRVLIGCGWLGAVAVPINAASKAPQIRHVLCNSGARLLIADGALLQSLDNGAFAGSALRNIWTLGETTNSSGIDCGHGSDIATARFNAGDATSALPAAAIAPTDTFAILYTSGTTGAAKGVVCPHAQFYWWAAYTSAYLEITDRDVLTTPLPLFHTNAINTFFQALTTGASINVLARFSVSDFWSAMARSEATVTYLLGAMVPMLLSRPPSADERDHRVRVALAPGVPEHVHAAFLARTGIAFVDGYGSTETNFVIGGTAAQRMPHRMGRAGLGIDVRVVDEAGIEVACETAGELTLRADDPQAFSAGYFADPSGTAAAWRDGWFHTGDRVIHYPDGSLRFVDRIKDTIRRRGENISSSEVEQALSTHPAVAACAVFPVPSPLAEDDVMAAVVLRAGHLASPLELAAYCATSLPRFAVPRYIDIVDDLPRTENGKVQKFVLRQRGVTGTTFDREA